MVAYHEQEFSDAVLAKADKLWVEPDPVHPRVLRVQASDPDHPHRVQLITDGQGRVDYATCTCPSGMNRGADTRCSHVAAALMWLSDTTEEKT